MSLVLLISSSAADAQNVTVSLSIYGAGFEVENTSVFGAPSTPVRTFVNSASLTGLFLRHILAVVIPCGEYCNIPVPALFESY
jgi:hypothetical protein